MQLEYQTSYPKLYKEFALSLIALNLFLFSGIFEPFWEIPNIVKYLFSATAFYFMVKLYISTQKQRFTNLLDLFVRNLFILMSVGLLLTSLRAEIFYIQEVFGARFYFMPYLIPVIFILIRYNILLFKLILKYTYTLLFVAIIIELFILLYFRDTRFYVRGMTAIYTFSIAPLLLSQVSHLYNNKLVSRVAFIYLFLFAIITANWGRRGETMEPLFFIVTAFFIKIRSKGLGANRRITFLFFAVIFSIVTYLFVIENKDKLYIFERGFSQESWEQSRGATIRNFLYDFGSKPYDWFIGRGLNGTFRKFTFGEDQISRSIEIGYFNILLKGGLLYLLPMMYLFIRAFYLGFFKSNNDLSKGLAMIVLWQMIYMVSFGMANYSLYYILVWIAVGAGFDSSLRTKSNLDLKAVLNSR